MHESQLFKQNLVGGIGVSIRLIRVELLDGSLAVLVSYKFTIVWQKKSHLRFAPNQGGKSHMEASQGPVQFS